MPGLIAYIAMITAVVSTALSVVREKERGTMEQVRMAPHRRRCRSSSARRCRTSCISLRLGDGRLLVAMVLFDLPMRGSWLAAARLRRRCSWSARSALGLLISTIADTQQVAFQLALLASFLPTLMLSGFIFPIASMPAFLQAVTYIVPARYFLIALRGDRAEGRRARRSSGRDSWRWPSSPRWCWRWRRCGCGRQWA